MAKTRQLAILASAISAGYLAALDTNPPQNPQRRDLSEPQVVQRGDLETGRLAIALQALAPHLEAACVDDDHAPARRCHRHLSGRRNQLNYREALANDLPIGSGEIESAHRYIAQQRLERPGAYWRVQHGDHMLALRINRRNGDREAYWAKVGKNPTPAANQNRSAASRKSAA